MNDARIAFFQEDVWPRLVPRPSLGHSRSIGHCWEMRLRVVLETRVIGMWVRREGVSWLGQAWGSPVFCEGWGLAHAAPPCLSSPPPLPWLVFHMCSAWASDPQAIENQIQAWRSGGRGAKVLMGGVKAAGVTAGPAMQ